MNAPLEGSVRFGAFQLDLRTGELRKAGTRINLPEQPFQVLRALLDRPGDLVTREELRQRLWPAETFVDFEHGLNAAVRRLRDALGDSADVPRFVETLPRRGYRFIAPVTEPPVERAPAPHVPAPPDPAIEPQPRSLGTPERESPPPRSMRAWNLPLTAMVLIAAAVAALWASGFASWSGAASRSVPPTTRSMLAVIPFGNLTGDPGQEYLGDGMTDELITQLGMIDPSRLGTISLQSAMQFKGTKKGADAIGSELGASHLLEGSLQTAGGRIGINVRLIEAQTKMVLWGHAYDEDARDLLTLERKVAEAVTRQIATHLGVARSNATANHDGRQHSTNPEAFMHYLKGRHHWGQDTAEGLDKAKEHFQEAIRLDADYALAYSGLADTYVLLGSDGFLPMKSAYALARKAAEEALRLDDMLAEAHTSLAAISMDYDWDWDKANRHFKHAVDLNENYETALRYYSFYLACMERHEQALNFAVRARDLSPVSPGAQMNLAVVHYFAHRYDQAMEALGETIDLDPDFGPAYVMRGRVLVAQGMPEKAVQELKLAHSRLGDRPDVITPLAYVLAKAGRKREARETLAELRRIAKPQDPAPIRLAVVHIGLGEMNEAFAELQNAVKARDWQLGMLKVEPLFDDLRSDKRFNELLEDVGLPR